MRKIKGYKSYKRALEQSAYINANPSAQALWHEEVGWRYFGSGEIVGSGEDGWTQLYVGQRGVLTTWPELFALGWTSTPETLLWYRCDHE